jgi:hypothetical protein
MYDLKNYTTHTSSLFFISRKNVYHHGGSTASSPEASKGYHPGTNSSHGLVDGVFSHEVGVCIDFLADLESKQVSKAFQ